MNNGLLDQDVREQVANSLVHKMLNSSPEIQEKILRMIVNRMSRLQIDTWFIAMNLYEPTSEAHALTDFLHKEHEHHTQEQEGEK
jgi:hypothetical protein